MGRQNKKEYLDWGMHDLEKQEHMDNLENTEQNNKKLFRLGYEDILQPHLNIEVPQEVLYVWFLNNRGRNVSDYPYSYYLPPIRTKGRQKRKQRSCDNCAFNWLVEIPHECQVCKLKSHFYDLNHLREDAGDYPIRPSSHRGRLPVDVMTHDCIEEFYYQRIDRFRAVIHPSGVLHYKILELSKDDRDE